MKSDLFIEWLPTSHPIVIPMPMIFTFYFIFFLLSWTFFAKCWLEVLSLIVFFVLLGLLDLLFFEWMELFSHMPLNKGTSWVTRLKTALLQRLRVEFWVHFFLILLGLLEKQTCLLCSRWFFRPSAKILAPS